MMHPKHRAALSRRRFLAQSGFLTAVLAGWPGPCFGKDRLSVAAAFDREVEAFMAERKVPGGALAVVRDRKLVHARGYGWGDRERQEPVIPGALFRIASISKPFTSAAIFKLIEGGRLQLETPVFDLLQIEPFLEKNAKPDPRLRTVTIRQCLQHTGGWDRAISSDPMFQSQKIARALDVPSPARQADIIRYVFGRPLNFDPGTRYAYSNFGYCVLGRVIEKVSGLSYEQYVRRELLKPMGIGSMRLGASLEHLRAAGEVKYYTPRNRKGRSVFAGSPGRVPVPYGTFCLEAMDSHGGWLASAIDLARFAAALDAPPAENCLRDESRRALYAPPPAPVSRETGGSLAAHYYACGWGVRPVGREGKANYWHAGSLPGTYTLLVRRWDGLSWAVLFNQRSEDNKTPDGAIDAALHRAADAVAEWPDQDLFVTR
ncbi:MAG TPA: serine hydrolase domain-containing protein [Verrucomicrobiota bacterium]|jgi:CubicO group peptidase (beta-lactamase class C family)|nr:serine hydrolase domain-containing protein [Verrucomicrobiota bacterium]HRT08000.1 serine hydrolase domain-containing protein [Candidatus Paceibacterota bacterium]HRT55467.1 serine hydrolase domain-containing protein [Candidatus Paceibacterota bacterium]